MGISTITPRHQRCGACNLCVLACSFHHEGSFGRRNASIDIIKDEREGEVEIVIFDEARDGRKPCDGCANEERPLCVQWCPVGALAIGRS
ncbi:MAG: hypothetical protein QF384_21150 [Alphaproteobacteria bacterium]|nr:hypothetical protein [Alphaproteobacteria bacterium]MDP6830996.1 hypothetical protein [Alphaproteobacteria bacterium]MDP6873256.1 hypothetical protein [Alphaproteobacteria bacterium]